MPITFFNEEIGYDLKISNKQSCHRIKWEFFRCVETAGRDVCQPAIYSLAFLLTVQLCLSTLSDESTKLCKGQFTESRKNNFLLCVKQFAVLELG